MKNSNNMLMLVVLYLSAFVSAFNENIINVALLDIIEEMGVTSLIAQWLVTGYMIVCAIIIMLMAYLQDRFSYRSLFFFAAICMIVGEVVCYIAPTFWMLLLFRLIQAAGSGIFIPLMMTAVITLAPHEKMGSFLSIGTACITLGPACAPVFSGIMVTLLGWRSVFIIPGVLTIVLALIAIKALRNINELSRPKLDIPSVLFAAICLTAFVYGLGEVIGNTLVGVIAIVVALVFLALFVVRQGRIPNPVLNMEPMKHSRFSLAMILTFVSMITSFSMSVLLPMYYEDVFDFTALIAGLLILPPIAVNAVVAMLAGRLMDRHGEWPLIPIGFLFIAVGLVAMALFSTSMSFVTIVICSMFVYCGVGISLAPSQTAGLKVLSNELHSHGVSIVNVVVMIAAAFGPSLFIGAMSSAAGVAEAAGTAYALAQATGFQLAVWISAAIGIVGLIVATPYSLKARKTAALDSADANADGGKSSK